MIAITYVGKSKGYTFYSKTTKRTYEFEWMKSQGIGSREEEVLPDDVAKMNRMKDKRGKKLFKVE